MQTIRELRAQIEDMENEELKLQDMKHDLGMIQGSSYNNRVVLTIHRVCLSNQRRFF